MLGSIEETNLCKIMLRNRVLAFLVLTAQLLVMVPETSAKVLALIVFGDSTVDSGNNNQISTVLKSNFQPYGRDYLDGKATGRFSNGRIAPDFISEGLGLKNAVPAYLDPAYNIADFATGVCFASAGTGLDNATSSVLSVMPLWKEVEYYKEYQTRLRSYLGEEKANEIIKESLYLISIGTNDFLENYYLLPRKLRKYSVSEYQDFLIGIAGDFVKDIYRLGARKMSLSGLSPFGCLPLERTTQIFYGSKCIQEYNNVARDFNTKMNEKVSKLNKELDGLQLVFSNPYDLVSEILNHPEAFGFENVRSACCGTGYYEMSYLCDKMNPFTCSDASKYVFWDSFHPTEKTNAIVASHVLKYDLSRFQ
ncbi:PREDICTED: GDSL esterase/lipase At4g26790-like [Camelina sativa]|uniref:GDSL esterase/lipase At4g26790-like n=1 Tax=Camelina sativa TaxID=90675 RepID=A0ABM0UBF7_CAMSA|nr:PREDICTED: GDSL esterase/lipase At4g26790-like [Camelina sativa]XP_010438696.1 PREDICTED: GDSL esterase/lipase At4g26790-like [Camelina sativa]